MEYIFDDDKFDTDVTKTFASERKTLVNFFIFFIIIFAIVCKENDF